MADRESISNRLAQVQRTLARAERKAKRQRGLIRLLECCRLRNAAARAQVLLGDIETVQKWLLASSELLNRELLIVESRPLGSDRHH
jgi:hypothetical protein